MISIGEFSCPYLSFKSFNFKFYNFFVLFLTYALYNSTEHDHVKDNISARLLQICTFGNLKLEDFKDLISVADYKTCETKMEKTPMWCPLTIDIFD